MRHSVNEWRRLPRARWRVTPETARLLQHWRHHQFSDLRPFFCQVEAVETVIWLTEVAAGAGRDGRGFIERLQEANEQANPGLARLALKLATGAGKTTVMAMLIAWQTVNAVRHPGSGRFTRGFLVVTPGLTIRDRLRVLQPNDPDSYYESRELVPRGMLGDLHRANIVITNYHAFMPRETQDISKGGRALLQGRGPELHTLETEGQVLQRVMPSLMGMLHLFGQLKRITRRWLDDHLVCKGGTYPAQLMYQELADRACSRITRAITAEHLDERPVTAVLDPYNPTGSTSHVNFTTSKRTRWQTDARRCHVNWVVCDSDWEAEFCRFVESQPQVRAYVKNHGLGLEVPYRYGGSEARTYLPDFIVLVDDGRGDDDLLHLVVEIKGYRREDAKDKKDTMDTYWVPGINHCGTYGRWAFAEFTDVYTIADEFAAATGARAVPESVT